MVESSNSLSSRRTTLLYWVQCQVCMANYQPRPPPTSINDILQWDWRDQEYYKKNSLEDLFANDYDFRTLTKEYLTLFLKGKIISHPIGLEIIVFLDLVLIVIRLTFSMAPRQTICIRLMLYAEIPLLLCQSAFVRCTAPPIHQLT